MPRKKRRRQTLKVKSFLCLRRLSGQWSTIPVTRDSTLQIALPIPRTITIAKRRMVQRAVKRNEPGKETTWMTK